MLTSRVPQLLTTLALVAGLAVLPACSKKEAPTAEAAAASAEAAAAAAAAAATPAPIVDAPAPTTPAATAPTTTPAATTAKKSGEEVYNTVCTACHTPGLLGAPKLGDKADWAPRIAQGKELLYKHNLEGFTGKKGTMPPKGGSTLSDEELRAGVDYMVSKSQ